ncbi:hypothetical protein DNHGIG_03460 [Collibacillus ludicampi]|uniref:DUF86 domain-containing protein n=1 Tax=Collibacillus ludicampi TaxID=2771369 RepID=A0AAV4LAF3_9BACL|nr:DUF86 domain-containing protein [Collibacillus ludicampi]GIM44797.1 hypothetical protein DNHGIG_03460 [Collibacillus ludicampi]
MFITAAHKEEIKKIFTVMERYAENLKRLTNEGRERFLTDPLLQLAAERSLHIAMECVTDVGNLLIDTLIMRDPSSYEDIVQILAEEEVIAKDFASHFLEAVRYRRILVHEYQKIVPDELYEMVRKHSGDFDQYRDSVYTYVGIS